MTSSNFVDCITGRFVEGDAADQAELKGIANETSLVG
jgi:hypothetical protein